MLFDLDDLILNIFVFLVMLGIVLFQELVGYLLFF